MFCSKVGAAEFSRASQRSSYFTSLPRREALRRYEAINQFFHSRRRTPRRWRFLLRCVIKPVLKGESKKKCLRIRLEEWGRSCYIIRAAVLKNFYAPPLPRAGSQIRWGQLVALSDVPSSTSTVDWLLPVTCYLLSTVLEYSSALRIFLPSKQLCCGNARKVNLENVFL